MRRDMYACTVYIDYVYILLCIYCQTSKQIHGLLSSSEEYGEECHLK